MSLMGFIAFHCYYRGALKHPVCQQVGGSPSVVPLSPVAVAQHGFLYANLVCFTRRLLGSTLDRLLCVVTYLTPDWREPFLPQGISPFFPKEFATEEGWQTIHWELRMISLVNEAWRLDCVACMCDSYQRDYTISLNSHIGYIQLTCAFQVHGTSSKPECAPACCICDNCVSSAINASSATQCFVCDNQSGFMREQSLDSIYRIATTMFRWSSTIKTEFDKLHYPTPHTCTHACMHTRNACMHTRKHTHTHSRTCTHMHARSCHTPGTN